MHDTTRDIAEHLARCHRSHTRAVVLLATIWIAAALLTAALAIATHYTHQPREYNAPPYLCGQPHAPAQEAAAIAVRP